MRPEPHADSSRASEHSETSAVAARCPACDASTWDNLPDPHPTQSMRSDLRIVQSPLNKWLCTRCGLVHRRTLVPGEVFASGYELYGHAPGAPRETGRQVAYADWIRSFARARPRHVLDVGCGNGSLLLALRRVWPDAVLRGIDPSPESTYYARAAGIDAQAATVDSYRAAADLVISVNVLEHTEDPPRFLHHLAGATDDGDVIVVCPDGRHPSTELLIADHLWSFMPAHLARWFDATGLHVTAIAAAPPSLGAFMLLRGTRAHTSIRVATASSPSADLGDARTPYLEAWRRLDLPLARSAASGPLMCFGIGEAAGLLRAYAPHTWSRVTMCVADSPETVQFGELQVDDYHRVAPPATMLLGVRPQDQPAVAERLEADGHRVVRWDHLVHA